MKLYVFGLIFALCASTSHAIIPFVRESADNMNVTSEEVSPFSFHKYSSIKSSIRFPKYPAETKQLVAEQIEKMFQVYVNRESKLDNYGEWVDPLPRIQNLVANAKTMSDKEFHSTASSIFLNLRDFHTNYILPQPYSCHAAIWPLFFDLVESDDVESNPKVVVRNLPKLPEVTQFAPHISEKVQIGDILVSINNKTFIELFEENKWMSGGANQYGGQRSVLSHFAVRNGALFLMPNETDATYVLEKKNGAQYTVQAPIVIRRHETCFEAASEETVGSTGFPAFDTWQYPFKISNKRNDLAYTPFFDDVKANFDLSAEYQVIPTPDPILSFSIYKKASKNLGIIKLDSFVPGIGSVELFLELFKGLLQGPLADTDALLIDIRGNGGGYANLADSLPQMFVADFQPPGARALVSSMNEKIFSSESFNGSEWYQAYNEVKPGETYTKALPFTSFEVANSIGQVYLKPVGVLNDAKCYSACDIFSASMQDSGAAVLFGEDPNTGAGGANVVGHRDFFVSQLPDEFSPLPNGQNMRVGWRQLIRNGKNAGKLIEDVGVAADILIRPKIRDFKPNITMFSQLDFIANKLIRQGRKTGQIWRRFLTEQENESDAEINKNIEFTGQVSGMTRLELYQDTEQMASLSIPMSKKLKSFTLESSLPAAKYGYNRFMILGYSADEQVLKTFREVRTVPQVTDYLDLGLVEASEYNWNFEEGIFAAIYNRINPDEHGWVKTSDNKLKISVDDNERYRPNIQTAASLFVKIPEDKKTSMHLHIDYDTEADFDNFILIMFVEGRFIPLFKLSGNGTFDNVLDLSPLAGYSAELQFMFISDPAVEAGGVTIHEISFKTE